MNDEKLKIILALLSGIVFSLIFILLAFILPVNDHVSQPNSKQNPKNYLEQVSKELRK
ncbi:hypothetical protein [Sulfuricurvum sp.]|uniref:hypothetical protein n=1 Tax=Sulfuricurvum sp. TaxID=2025608 RepID=UPI003BB0FB36